MTRPILRTIATLLLLAGALVPVGAEEGIVVHVPRDESAKVAGGSTVQRALTVENTSADAVTIQVDVSTVDGIRRIGETEPRVVPAGAWDVFPLAFRVEPTASAQRHSVAYAVFANFPDGRRRVEREGVLSIDVESMPRFDVELVDAPSFAVGREPFDVDVVVANTGNVPLDLELDFRSSGRSSPTEPAVLSDPLPLAIGETRGVHLVLSAPVGLDRAIVDRIEVLATDRAWGVTRRASTTVELVPQVLPWQDAWVEFPVRVESGAGVELDEGAWATTASAGVSGASAVGTGGDRVLDFDLRKTTQVVPFSAEEHPDDRYSLRYTGPSLEVDLGDRSRSVSPLVQPQEQTRGASVRVFSGRVAAEALVQDTSRDEATTGLLTASAGLVGAERDPDARYEGTLSATASLFEGWFRDGLTVSLDQSYAVTERLMLDGELATSLGVGALIPATGARAAARLEQPAFDVVLSGHAVGADFPGPLQDSHALSLAAAIRPGLPGLRIDASAAGARNDVSLGVSDGSWPYRRESSLAASYERGAVFARTGITDRVEGSGFLSRVSATTRRVGAEARLTADVLSVDGESTLVMRTEYPGPVQKNGLETRVGLGTSAGRSDLDVALGFRQADLAAPVSTATVDLSLSGDHSVDRFQAGARVNASVPLDDRGSYTLGFSLESALLVGRSGLLAAELATAYDGAVKAPGWDSFRFSLSYSTGLGITYARRADVGAVEGRLVDAVTDETIAGAVVRLGDQATVSNEAGRYEFPAVAVGEHRLVPDATTIPPGRLVRQESTVVRVEPRRTTVADVELVSGHTIDGTLVTVTPTAAALVGGDESPDWQEAVATGRARSAPVEGARVTISNGVVTLTDFTDSSGAFGFTGLEPGAWVVRLPRTSERSRLQVEVSDDAAVGVPEAGAPGTGSLEPARLTVVLGGGPGVEIRAAEVLERPAPRMLEGSTLTLP